MLPVAWLAGSFAGRFSPVPLTLPALTAALTVILGGLVAADRPLSVTIVAGCGLLLGLLHGVLNGIEFAKQHAITSSSVGVAVALFVVVSLLAGQATTVRAAWARRPFAWRGVGLPPRASHAGMDFTRVLRLQLAKKTKKIHCNMNSYTVI